MAQTAASPAGLASDVALATGAFTSDGTDTGVTIGFNPRYIVVVNETDNIVWSKMQGMQPANSIKEAGGAQTVDTTGAILVPADAGLHEPGSAMVLSAALVGNGKAISWAAFG